MLVAGASGRGGGGAGPCTFASLAQLPGGTREDLRRVIEATAGVPDPRAAQSRMPESDELEPRELPPDDLLAEMAGIP
eukprot:11181563-Lingulodinium_polyedra.AAC.1